MCPTYLLLHASDCLLACVLVLDATAIISVCRIFCVQKKITITGAILVGLAGFDKGLPDFALGPSASGHGRGYQDALVPLGPQVWLAKVFMGWPGPARPRIQLAIRPGCPWVDLEHPSTPVDTL